MIVSFHPIIEAHKNIICAGRPPNDDDLAAIRQADAVILPQGCSETLYRMARQNCPHVFPNLDVRFDFPGKSGQIRLFGRLKMDHPKTYTYASVADFPPSSLPLDYPVVVKFDWGGQGETVFKVVDRRGLAAVLEKAKTFEATGQYGFLVQEYIGSSRSSLRVVVIGSSLFSYWRLQPSHLSFGTSIAAGAAIDHASDPALQSAGRAVVRKFCELTGLQLAGFDFIFRKSGYGTRGCGPLMLEINYYFGRTGLGGSDRYYDVLTHEVDKWLATLSLNR